MKRILTALLVAPALLHAQVNVDSWIRNMNGKTGSYWAQTGTAPAPAYTWTLSPDSADVLKVCYSADSVWVRANGLTDTMGPYKNPGYCNAQNYVYRFPRNPASAATKVTVPKVFAIGALLNGVPVYGLSNSFSWNGTSNMPGPGGLGIWNVEVGMSEGFVLDTAFGAHPQQDGAYHTHTTPYRFYRNTPAGQHSPLVGYAFDGYPIYGPYGYTVPTDAGSGVSRMKSGYSLRSITQRHTLPGGGTLTAAQYGPDVSSTYPLGYYCEDYEWLATNGGTVDEYNGRYCVTPEYPGGTYAYFVTTDATGAAAFPYYIGIKYYGTPDAANFVANSVKMPASSLGCLFPLTSGVSEVLAGGAQFLVYPNPSDGHIVLQTSGNLFSQLAIYDMTGSLVLGRVLTSQKTTLDLDLSPGLYTVRCYDAATGITEVQRLTIK